MNWIQKNITHTIYPIVFILSVLTFIFIFSHLSKVGGQNQTYARYNSCALSIPALERDAARIEKCWSLVQKDTGTNVKRYDKELHE